MTVTAEAEDISSLGIIETIKPSKAISCNLRNLWWTYLNDHKGYAKDSTG